jgi:hypothetical protein
MVQVDVFWSFGLGAGFAAAAARQIGKQDDPFESKFFVKNLIFLSCFFVPSGAILLWGFPEWETMQVGTYKTIPAWLVGAFTLTNVTQGILGYWLAWKLIRGGNYRGAWMLCGLGYFLMFFILVHGWDGMGYQRFFYSCSWWGGARECTPWTPETYWVLKWATLSPVAWTLYAMGAVMLPLLFYWMSDWVKRGYELGDVDKERAVNTSRMDIVKVILRLVFVHVLGAAIVSSLLIHWLGWYIGVPLFLVLAYFLMVRRGGLTDRDMQKIILKP